MSFSRPPPKARAEGTVPSITMAMGYFVHMAVVALAMKAVVMVVMVMCVPGEGVAMTMDALAMDTLTIEVIMVAMANTEGVCFVGGAG